MSKSLEPGQPDVHAYPDGTLANFHGPRRLARYTAHGTLHDPDALTRSAA